MVDRPADLPDYKNPPLVEVVLSVQFAELQGYRTVHAGLLWEDKFREAYPIVAEQPPLEPIFETFGPQASAPQFQIKQMPGPQMPRLWFMNLQKTELVQIQADQIYSQLEESGRGRLLSSLREASGPFFLRIE